MMHVTQKPVPLKGGRSFPPGSEIRWTEGEATIHGKLDTNGVLGEELHHMKLGALSAAKALGIEIPSNAQVGRWVTDSVCDSVLGNKVEPDGFDPEGSPSWLRAFELI